MSDQITQKQYTEEIQNLAKEALEIPEDERHDWIHEAVDSHQWVIYTWYNHGVLMWTDNQDAYFEQMGECPDVDNFGALSAQLAYFAMVEDISARVASRENAA